MKPLIHKSIHPYRLVLVGTGKDYKWNIQMPSGHFRPFSNKAIAWTTAKSLAISYRRYWDGSNSSTAHQNRERLSMH